MGSAVEQALRCLGKGFDVSCDFRLKYCKGKERLISVEEKGKEELVVPGFGAFKNVSVDIKCDKGERIRYRSDVLDFNQMSEVFNQRSSLSGKIPSGLFNSTFGFDGSSWAQDAARTKCLAMDGHFISLFNLRLDCKPLTLSPHVINAVPSTWDPAAIARFIENYGTHIIVGLSMGGQDVINVRQEKSSLLSPSEIKEHLDKLGHQIFTGTCALPLLPSKSKDYRFKVPEAFNVFDTQTRLDGLSPMSCKEGITVICSKRGGNTSESCHSEWLLTVPAMPDVVNFTFVPITSLLKGVPGTGFLSHAINLYLRYKPPAAELKYFLDFQYHKVWAPMHNDLPLGPSSNRSASTPALYFNLMGPKLYVSTSQVIAKRWPVTGIRLHLEGKKNNRLAIHLQHLSNSPMFMGPQPEKPPIWQGSDMIVDDRYYEPIHWKMFAHVCTAPVKYDPNWSISGRGTAFIVTGAQLLVKAHESINVLHMRLQFSEVSGCTVSQSKWARGLSGFSEKSGFMSMSFTGSSSALEREKQQGPITNVDSGVFAAGPPVPVGTQKLLKYVDTSQITMGPQDSPGYWLVTGAKLDVDLDYAFDLLGAGSSKAEQVDHPILMTESICNPVSSRAKMAELLFETYGVPSIAFGVDAAFSYKYNQQLGICGEDGLTVCAGLTTCHVIPFVKGEPVYDACCRTNVGGYHITDFLKQLLSLKYPYHMSSITWEKAEELKMEHCYIALDYMSELQIFQKDKEDAKEKTRCWQLPWVAPPQEEAPSQEELARKAALKEKQGQRLREMAASKRSLRISELENELRGLEDLLQQLEEVEEPDFSALLAKTGYLSLQELESALLRVTQSLRKAKGEPNGTEEKLDASLAEKYPLASVPDDMLTPEQVKEKRKQIFLKTTTEGRLRAKKKRFEEETMREMQNQQDEEKRLENPELYLEELRAKYKELSEKVEQKQRLKTNGTRTNGNHNSSGGVGRGERLNAAQRERMRLLTTAAFDRGKGEDTFGARDEDWQLYKLMSKDNDDDDNGQDDDEAELARVSSKLQDIDPTFVAKPDTIQLQGTPELLRFRPSTAEDYQIIIGVERFRCPEILFQPGMVGVDQAGLDEMAGVSLRRLSSVDDSIRDRISNSVLVTGGSSLFPGLVPRLEAGIRQVRPYLSPLKVVRASDPILDAWRGAAAYATSLQFPTQTFSMQDYYEKGENWLSRYNIVYTL